MSNVAVLVAFAIGSELGGVVGALLAMPLAATYPTIEKLWLRDQFGDDVVAEHEGGQTSSVVAEIRSLPRPAIRQAVAGPA